MRFVWNVFLSLIVIGALWYFIYLRFDDNYNIKWIAHVDGCVQSLIASLLFLILVFFLAKPSIKIASYIAEYPGTDSANPHLKIKIVNHSLFRAFDLVIYAYKVTKVHVSGSDVQLTLLGKIEGTETTIPYMESAFFGTCESTKTHAAQMRLSRITTDEKIREVLDNEHGYLMIYVKAKHGLSGLQGNFIKKFDSTSFIKKGRYRHGFFTTIL